MSSALATVPPPPAPDDPGADPGEPSVRRRGRPRLAVIEPAALAGRRPRRLDLLGGFVLAGAADLPAPCARLVALLALRGPLPRCVVAAELWPESDETRAGGGLRTALWRLGRVAPGVVVGDDVLGLGPGLVVDAARVVSSAQALLRDHRHRPVEIGPLLDSGELLPGWLDEWVLGERDRLRELRVAALEVVSGRAAVRRRHALAIEAARAAIELDPWRESAYRSLIRAQLGEGNRAQALATYRLLADLLRDELGFAPAEETRQLLALDHGRSLRRYSSGG